MISSAKQQHLPALAVLALVAAFFATAVAARAADTTTTATPAASDAARPEPVPVSTVVELFTSQGCSSCPPADKLLETYVKREDVLALSYPVDYWDYLGWKDTLASAGNSHRQREYAKARGDGAVYTPQVVVNGIGHAVGSDPSQIERQIAKTSMAFAKKRVPMRFWRTSGMLVVETASAPDGVSVENSTVWLAPVQDVVEVEIQRGENRGRKIRYFNVVHELTPIGMWTGKPMRIQLSLQPFSKSGNTRYAVIMQEGTSGQIIGAAWLGW